MEVFIILVHHILKLLMRPNYVNEEKMSRVGFYSASLIPNFIRTCQTLSNYFQLKFFFYCYDLFLKHKQISNNF